MCNQTVGITSGGNKLYCIVVSQIKVLGHRENLLHGSGNCDYIPPQTEDAHQNGPQVYG